MITGGLIWSRCLRKAAASSDVAPCSVSAPRESPAQLAELEEAGPLENRSAILAFSIPGLAAKASCHFSIILEGGKPLWA